MLAATVQIRRDLCARAQCDAVVDFEDPCAACPNGHWSRYSVNGCNGPARSMPEIKPAPSWPLALLPLKLLARPGDRGAGDIIARTIGPIGGTAFKVWYKRIFGKGCGCGARQEILNARWPM